MWVNSWILFHHFLNLTEVLVQLPCNRLFWGFFTLTSGTSLITRDDMQNKIYEITCLKSLMSGKLEQLKCECNEELLYNIEIFDFWIRCSIGVKEITSLLDIVCTLYSTKCFWQHLAYQSFDFERTFVRHES